MAAETNGFLIDGKVYEVPNVWSLDADEAQVLYDKSGAVVEDFHWLEDETDDEHAERVGKLMRPPGFMTALAQIAYQRANPSVKARHVEVLVGKTNRSEMFSTLGAPEEDEPDVPLASTSEPDESSASGSLENTKSTRPSNGSSGSDSTNGSDARAAEVVSIGTGR